jgi:ketosteroid isomerase-like protein
MSDAETVAGWFEQGGREYGPDTLEWWEEHAWHPEIEWRAIEGAPDDVGLMVGAERMKRYYAEWLELFVDIRNEVRDRQQLGDVVVLAVHVTARAKTTGMPLELNYALAAELEDGRLRRGREYATLEEALRAASRSPRARCDARQQW